MRKLNSKLQVNKRNIQKQVIAFAFAMLFCIETFAGTFYVADYYLETSAYSAKCINKEKPQMHCNGHCQLQKKLNETDNKDKQNNERKNEMNDEVISSKTFFAAVQIPLATNVTHQYFILNSGTPIDQSSQLFRPPKS